ncbi:MAG: helix-turn-helix domain-containing protein [Planctomycetota bacterium]|nr:helix-turn-helix domain-containing protein [Planctomycetota bacterium]
MSRTANDELRKDRMRAEVGLRPDGFTMLPNRLLLDRRFWAMLNSDRCVLLVLLAHRRQSTGEAFPAQRTIAALTGLGERTVRRAVARLSDGGWIKSKRGRAGAGRAEAALMTYRFPCFDPATMMAGTADDEAATLGFVPDTDVTESSDDGPAVHVTGSSCDDPAIRGRCSGHSSPMNRPELWPGNIRGTEDGTNSPAPPGRSRRSRRDYPAAFSAAWEAYGRRGAKWPACQQYARAIERIKAGDDPPQDPHAWLLGQIRAYRAAADAAGTEERYIVHFERWLRDDRWDADPATWEQQFAGRQNRASPAQQPAGEVEGTEQTAAEMEELKQRRAGGPTAR